MEKLFDDKIRNDDRYSGHLEKSYDFYDTTAKPEFVAIRDMLNDWFSRYPETDKRQLKRDFYSHQFDSAFFELFIHELFYQQGFSLTPHPTLPNSTKNPDFLARKGDFEIYLEAKVATDKSNDQRTLENKRGAIYDELQKLVSVNYLVEIEDIVFKSDKQAKLSKLRKYFQKWLDACHASQHPQYNDYDEHGDECFSYDDEDIKISLRAHAGIIMDDHPIASYLGGSFCGGCEEALAGAIREKGAKYGQLDRPYIVCVNMIGVRHPRTDEIYNTLLGLRRHFTDTHNYQNAPFSIEMDGVLKNPTGPIFTQVSAFFITQVFPSNLHAAKHWLIEHPATKNKIDLGKLDLTNHNESSVRTKKSIKEILYPYTARPQSDVARKDDRSF
ncbi:MAG: hypothetical protein J7619_10115 [Dyadobacter sp.]|uniref:hypothetical protein n=1 Tax=Dyadobacter sp. TaxID=1914288 RepID=UPI001AFF4C9C|nr:hypothetical protein [Dyadobacter sp.]MBO9613040.1 hypothetical protein [Dyadobacter sp.]